MIICERELEVKKNDKEFIITVKMREPYLDEKLSGDWACSFEIIGFEKEINKTFYGIDSFQALLHCITGINVNLEYLRNKEGFVITWFEQDKLHFKTI